jgi:hypothetical protein
VLKGLGAGAVVAGGGVAVWQLAGDDGGTDGRPPSETTQAPATPDPASSLGDALVVIGRQYLDRYPDEADRQLLLDALPALEGQVPERPGQGLRVLADQAMADHGSGDVVDLGGWVLSRTECRAAALYAL